MTSPPPSLNRSRRNRRSFSACWRSSLNPTRPRTPATSKISATSALFRARAYYVVLLFRTDLDWVAAQDHFALQQVDDPFGAKRTGIGRVIDGGAYLKRILR